MALQVAKCKDGSAPHPSLAFHHKCEQEKAKLKSRLQKQLQNDMLNLFYSQCYSDVTFVTEDKGEISAHSSLLKIRVPKFYHLYVEATSPDGCHILPKIELPFVTSEQLEKLLRIVYTGEQPEEEEAQLLDLLLRLVQLTISNDWEKNKVLKNNMSSSQDLEYKAVDSTQMNDGSGGFFLQSEVEMLRNGNRTDDDNVSASDTVTWSGTLADLTDPFSISSSDLMNISTLNANDDHMDATSVTSIEDLNEMEMFDTLVPAPAEVTKQPLVSCFDENREQKVVGLKEFDDNDDKLNLAASFRSSNEVKDFDFIDMKLDGLHVENDSTKIVNETTESRPKLVRKNTFELNAEELMEVVREPDTTFVIDTSGRSDSKRVCSLPIMVLSHESKDGDSGVGSVSRKLSTPSSVGHHSIGSDNVPDSPTGSIPKDDSLEFCPDSLASEEANVVRVSPSGPGSVDYSLKGPHLKLEHSEAVLGDFIASKEVSTDLHLPTCDASLGSKKLAWSGVEDLYEEISKEAQFELYTEKHRWAATNGSDSQYKSAAAAQQPSAADLTFNVDDNVHCDVGTKDSVANLSGETTTNQMHSKPARVNCSIKLDFVPFLKEKRTMINSDSIGDTKSYTHPLVNTPTIAPAATGDVNNANAVGQPSLDAKISFPLIDELLPQRVQNAKKTTPESDILSETHIEETSAQVITYLSKTDEVGPVSDALDDVSEEPQKSELQSPQLGRKENFYMFIDVSDVQSKAKENCEEISEICQKEMPKEKAAVGASDELDIHPKAQSAAVESDSLIGTEDAAIPAKPQPVYMFIEASSPHAPSNGSSFQEQHPKVSDKKTSFLRRRIPFTGSPKPHCRRPKSESAATLFEDKEVAADGDKIVKRLSLTFGTEHGECQPLEKAASDKDIPKGAQPFKKEPPFRLGEDLLKMFLNEVNTDVTVRIDGKDIKAHKSILTSRCAYFAAMLSGGWVESTGNVIKLQGFSYEAVHFALCHIYSGEATIPDNIEISELASLADMLGLEGLKEVVTLALKIKYCHFFHKPCPTCITSVSECLLIATSYGLDELQEKCLKWITRHMSKTWPTKAFAALPEEILQKCFFAAKDALNPGTVLDTLLRCDKLMATLPHVRWTEPVFSVTTRLAEVSSSYLAANFADVITSDSFLALRTGQTWSIHALETTFLLAVERLPLDVACKVYVRLHALSTVPRQVDVVDDADINENFDILLNKIHRQVEHFLIHNANRVVRCNSWALLSADLQKKIKDAAVIVFEFGKPTAAPPRLSSLNRRFSRSRNSNSTSSASPTIERARTSSASGAILRVSQKDARMQKKTDGDSSSKGVIKSATLPRTNVKDLVKQGSGVDSQRDDASTSSGASRIRTRPHGDSRTLPLNLPSDKKSDLNVVKGHAAALHGHISKSMNVVIENRSSATAGTVRPKSWPAKEKPNAATSTSRNKEKTPIKESPRDGRMSVATVLGISSRATGQLNNGVGKLSSPSARPKSVAYNGTTRITKHSPDNSSCGFRDSKASSLRKAVSSDLHRKENKDDTKGRSVTRPRSDDISCGMKKTTSQRASSMRSSRSSVDKP